MATEVNEVVPGEYDVRSHGLTVRVLVPAGVGVPGVAEDELAVAVVEELLERGSAPAAVIDVSALLRADPGLLERVAARVEAQG